MNRTLFSLVCLLLYCGSVVAQPVRLVAIAKDFYDMNGVISGYDTSSFQYKSGSTRDAYSDTLGYNWVLLNADTFLNTNCNVSDTARYRILSYFNAAGQADSIATEILAGTTVAYLQGESYAYTTLGQIQQATLYFTDDSSRPVQRVSHTYAGADITGELVENYVPHGVGWQPISRVIFSYVNGHLAQKDMQRWAGAGFETVESRTWYYDGRGNMLSIADRQWNATTQQMDTFNLVVYAYSAADEMLQSDMYVWPSPTSRRLQDRHVYGYKGGHMLADTFYRWTNAEGRLLPMTVQQYHYNASGLVDTLHNYRWILTATDSGYLPESRTRYTYTTTTNRLLVEHSEAWDGTTNAWRMISPAYEHRYYYTIIPAAGIAGMQHDDELQLYPNPANDFITLKLDNKQTSTIAIYNTTGALLRQWEEQGGNTQRTIPLHGFEDGNYILTVKNEHGERTSLQFSVHH